MTQDSFESKDGSVAPDNWNWVSTSKYVDKTNGVYEGLSSNKGNIYVPLS